MPFLFSLSRPSDNGPSWTPLIICCTTHVSSSGQLSYVLGAVLAPSEVMFALVHITGEEVKAQSEEGLCSGLHVTRLPSQVTCSQVTMASDFAEDCP